jgi:hypothetical protein
VDRSEITARKNFERLVEEATQHVAKFHNLLSRCSQIADRHSPVFQYFSVF